MSASIAYQRRSEIDIAKWDACVQGAANGLIYAESRFLDGIADNWDALVLGDYDIVMPLPWRKKWGMQYVYQPPFTAQLGVFGNRLTPEIVQPFLDAIPLHFKLVEVSLNPQNMDLPGSHLQERINYVLPLHNGYETLARHYREQTKRNIRKAAQYGCTVRTGIQLEEIVALASGQAGQQETDAAAYQRIVNVYKQFPLSTSYGVYLDKQLLASAAFFRSGNRAYYLLVGNHPNGRTLGASHLLVDAFIRDHSGSNIVLDFEGSDIRSLAFFYASFGAQAERYPFLRLNRLPLIMKWLKG